MLQVFEAKISTELFVFNCVLEKSEIKKFLSRRMFIWFVYSSGWVGGWALQTSPSHPTLYSMKITPLITWEKVRNKKNLDQEKVPLNELIYV